MGLAAAFDNLTGRGNTAIGYFALSRNLAGNENTAVGLSALEDLNGGIRNTAVGKRAGRLSTTGSDNIYLGAEVPGAAGESNTMYLGRLGTQTRTFIAGVRGITTGVNDAVPVMIDSNGQLGTACRLLRRAPSASHAKRVSPSQPRKTRKVAVGGDELTAVLDRDSGEIGVRHQRSLDVRAQPNEDVPVVPARRDHHRAWLLDEPLTERERRWHGRGRIEDPGICDDTKKAGEDNFTQGKRLWRGRHAPEPGRVTRVLRCVLPVGVDQHVDVR
jgi:hypothetical protein